MATPLVPRTGYTGRKFEAFEYTDETTGDRSYHVHINSELVYDASTYPEAESIATRLNEVIGFKP